MPYLDVSDDMPDRFIHDGKSFKEKLTEGSPSVIKIIIPGDISCDTLSVQIECKVYFCDDHNVCRVKDFVFDQVVNVNNEKGRTRETVRLNVKVTV